MLHLDRTFLIVWRSDCNQKKFKKHAFFEHCLPEVSIETSVVRKAQREQEIRNSIQASMTFLQHFNLHDNIQFEINTLSSSISYGRL